MLNFVSIIFRSTCTCNTTVTTTITTFVSSIEAKSSETKYQEEEAIQEPFAVCAHVELFL